MKDLAKVFAANLKREVAKSSFSPEEIAVRAEIHRTQIYKLLQGKQLCRIDTLVKLGGALGIEPATLIEGITWNPAASTKGEFELRA